MKSLPVNATYFCRSVRLQMYFPSRSALFCFTSWYLVASFDNKQKVSALIAFFGNIVVGDPVSFIILPYCPLFENCLHVIVNFSIWCVGGISWIGSYSLSLLFLTPLFFQLSLLVLLSFWLCLPNVESSLPWRAFLIQVPVLDTTEKACLCDFIRLGSLFYLLVKMIVVGYYAVWEANLCKNQKTCSEILGY